MTRKPILLNMILALALVALLCAPAGAAVKPKPVQPVAVEELKPSRIEGGIHVSQPRVAVDWKNGRETPVILATERRKVEHERATILASVHPAM